MPSQIGRARSEEHTSELQSHDNLVCRLLLEKKNQVCVRTDLAIGNDNLHEKCGTVVRLRIAASPAYVGLHIEIALLFFFLRGRGPAEFPLFPLRTLFHS